MKRITGPHVEVYRDRQGGWRWRRRAKNGRIIAASTESYRRARAAVMNEVAATKPVPVFLGDEEVTFIYTYDMESRRITATPKMPRPPRGERL